MKEDVADQLRELGVQRGILLQAAREGVVAEIACGMKPCLCPHGNRYFEERPAPTSPWAPSVDHIVEKNRGGRLELSNVRLAHVQCNRMSFTMGQGIKHDKDLARLNPVQSQTDPIESEPNLAEIVHALEDYGAARRSLLGRLGIPASNRDPLAEFSERFVAALIGGRLAPSRVEKGYDVVGPDGTKVQVKYLANPAGKWVNEHHIRFVPDVDGYALVLFEGLSPMAAIGFSRQGLPDVCIALGKRHPNQETDLQLTQRNVRAILEGSGSFAEFGVTVFEPPQWAS